jgi:tetratricopeptide (TPR) repeat protein
MLVNTLKTIRFFFIIVWTCTAFAQEDPEDIALESDDFQVYFYESIKQKGIENYDKAILALQKCLQLDPENDVVLFELGKNFYKHKDYANAKEAFEQAIALNPNNRWYWAGNYNVAYANRDYEKAIPIVQKLITFKDDYKEDLATLYMFTQRYEEALMLIEELLDTKGKSQKLEQYKAQILTTTKYKNLEVNKLFQAIEKDPKNEFHYISLIYLYSENNQEDKAYEIAKQLEKNIPTSDWAQVSLFKFHLENNQGEQAVLAMQKALSSPQIDNKIKHRILNEFLIFAKDKKAYGDALEQAISAFEGEANIAIHSEIGKFFQNQQLWPQAIKYYELHLANHSDDVQTKVLLLQVLNEASQWKKMGELAEENVALYPLQPEFYFYLGLSQNQQKLYSKAIKNLEEGLDYIVDNTNLEANFYIQLGEAHHALGQENKKTAYFQKAEKLLKKNP